MRKGVKKVEQNISRLRHVGPRDFALLFPKVDYNIYKLYNIFYK